MVVKNLCKIIKFKKEKKIILKNINLSCPDKGLILLHGNSGCGKTTLLNILEGLDENYTGDVQILGKNLKKINKTKYLRDKISIIFQDCNLINGYTVLELLKIRFGSKKIKFDPLLIETKLSQFKINNILNKKVETLSGGEKQILALTMVQFENSKIVFCDEPTGSIDIKNELIAVRLLKQISINKLVFVVSHNFELFSKFADKVFFMNEGEINEQ